MALHGITVLRRGFRSSLCTAQEGRCSQNRELVVIRKYNDWWQTAEAGGYLGNNAGRSNLNQPGQVRAAELWANLRFLFYREDRQDIIYRPCYVIALLLICYCTSTDIYKDLESREVRQVPGIRKHANQWKTGVSTVQTAGCLWQRSSLLEEGCVIKQTITKEPRRGP